MSAYERRPAGAASEAGGPERSVAQLAGSLTEAHRTQNSRPDALRRPPTLSADFDRAPDRVALLAERSYVGAVLHLRGQDARDALERVRVADLADPQLRAVLEALHALTGDGQDPDPALVTPRMLELGLVPRDKAGLANALLVDLLTGVPAPSCWSAYASEILRESAKRRIVEACVRATQAADGPDLAVAVQVLAHGLGEASVAVERAIGAAR